MHDVIIKNGTLIDGTGEPMFEADIAVNGGKITEIGDLGGERAQTEIDATDHYVTPGFVDLSNRSDVYWRLFQDPQMESLLHQGITTIIGGNSGASLAPLYNEQMFHSTQKWVDVKGININWQTMKEFLSIVEAKHLSMNFGTFVGHGTLRRGIVGDEMRDLSDPEMKVLITQMYEGMQEGALGVSLGLLYTHARNTNEKELLGIAETVKANDGLLAVHLRDEDRELITAVDEILDITEETGVRTHITHMKSVGQQYWPLMRDALERVDAMQVKGFDVTFDVYPYTVTGSVLYTFLPNWISEGGKKMLLARLKNQTTYDQVYRELRDSPINMENAVVSIAPHAAALLGRNLGDIAREREVDVSRLILDLLLASEGRVIILFDALSEENVVRALESPYSIVTSNSPGYTLTGELGMVKVHPRSFGAFPRLLARYVQEKKVLSWERAIHKATYKAAQRVGITDRGILREGFKADIAVINPKTVDDVATVEDPLSYARGVQYLLVNGVPTIVRGKMTGVRGGQIVRRG